MTIWLLTVLLLVGLAGLGLRQGAIRVAFSFAGIVFGALLAGPLGHLVRFGLVETGLKNPVWLQFLPPCIGFIIVLSIFKILGGVMHHKAEVYYKHKASDVRRILWERVNHRLGLCLGVLNGAAYLVIVSIAIYTLSYWTYQMATPESDPKTVRIVNQLGKDLQSTGMSKVAASVDRMPDSYYNAADIVGLIYHNPLLQARLSRYPAILSLAERPEFQDLATDTQFTELQMKQAPVLELIKYPKVQAILDNPELMRAISDALVPNLKDLRGFLESGVSQKFEAEKILGRWDFDSPATVALVRKARPNMSSADMQQLRRWYVTGYSKTTFTATTDNKVYVKNVPKLNRPPGGQPTVEYQKWEGTWSGAEGKYQVKLSVDGKDISAFAEIQNGRLAVSGGDVNLVFAPED